jgi:predicted ATPase
LEVIAEAEEHIAQTGEIVMAPEILRVKGELMRALERPDDAAAEACFNQSLDAARAREAKGWELRATTSLARLWRDHGKAGEARDLLAPVYDWFTEGFDTADLKDAKALLAELS